MKAIFAVGDDVRGDTKCRHVVGDVIQFWVTPWLEFKPQLWTNGKLPGLPGLPGNPNG